MLTWCHGKDEYWHGFSANKVLMWLHGKDEYWHGFKANKVSRQLYGKRRVLVQLHYKGKWWCDFIADASANITSIDKYKCWRSFMTKISGATISMQRKNMDVASLWSQVLIWLLNKDKCWCGYVAKTFDVATLQRSLIWLRWKDKCVQLNYQDKG